VRCKLPQQGLRQSPSRNRFWCILALKSVIWWQQFNGFPENHLQEFHPLPSRLREAIFKVHDLTLKDAQTSFNDTQLVHAKIVYASVSQSFAKLSQGGREEGLGSKTGGGALVPASHNNITALTTMPRFSACGNTGEVHNYCRD